MVSEPLTTATSRRVYEDPLERHFAGKRGTERIPGAWPVALEGREGRVAAEVRDLSEGGLLVEILEDAFGTDATEGRIPDCLARIESQFGSGLRVWFTDAQGVPLALDAEVVRVMVGPGPHDGVRLGCRLLRAPDAAEQHQLGFDAAREGRTASTPRGRPVAQALLYATSGPVLGPVATARLRSIDGPRVVLEVDAPADGSDLVARLGAPLVRITVTGRRGPEWDTLARLVDVHRDAGVAGAYAVALEPERPPPRAWRKAARRRA